MMPQPRDIAEACEQKGVDTLRCPKRRITDDDRPFYEKGRLRDTVKTIFNCMSMPLPEDGEYTSTVDGGLMVFLNDPACVMRLIIAKSFEDFDIPKHPHILQPLGSRKSRGIRVDINPGIICPVRDADACLLGETLDRDGLSLWDKKTLNCGYIPLSDETARRAVVLDIGAINQITHGVRYAMNLLDRNDIQDTFYQPLRQAFDRAWPENAELPDRDGMAAFWRLCARFKDEGKLVTSWLTKEWTKAGNEFKRESEKQSTYKNAIKGSSLYAQRWRRFGFA